MKKIYLTFMILYLILQSCNVKQNEEIEKNSELDKIHFKSDYNNVFLYNASLKKYLISSGSNLTKIDVNGEILAKKDFINEFLFEVDNFKIVTFNNEFGIYVCQNDISATESKNISYVFLLDDNLNIYDSLERYRSNPFEWFITVKIMFIWN